MFACSGSIDKHSSRYSSFPDESQLKSQVIRLDTALFRYPFRVAVRDYIAIVMDLHNTDHYFHVFTYPDWKHLVSFGRRGQAPGEMLSAETFHFHSLDSIWTLDANKMEICRWQISPSEWTATTVERIQIDKKIVRALDFYPMDSAFLIPDYLGEARYSLISKSGEYICSHGRIPSKENYKQSVLPALAQAWRSFIAYNPRKCILAMVTQLGEVMDIYNLKEKDEYIVSYGPYDEPEFKVVQGEGIPSGIMGFSDVHITDNYIYTVFHGRTFKEITLKYQQGEVPEDGGRYIYVFDLDGQPVHKYTLDRAIYGINVDEDSGTIIATDVNSNSPIVQFNIPNGANS